MMVAKLSGALLVAKGSLASLQGLRLFLAKPRVSSFNPVELNHRCFEGCILRFPTIFTPQLSISMRVNASSKQNPGMDMHAQKEGSISHKQTARIHDFCLGIPFGGFVFGGGLLGFIFSRNPACQTTGVLFGGAVLALGVLSLKVWKKGQSSLPFILGQAAIAAALLWKHMQLYSLTKKLLPSALYVFVSAAMICFYSYVLIAGGNPPPKKLRTAPPTQL